ncbi:MAG: Na/Pi cotransporter family protein [Peptococcaceae bacterium]
MLNGVLFLIGLLVFLIGLYILKAGLDSAGSRNIKRIICHFTGTAFKGCMTGTILTMLLQSSSAVTVITIGLVDTGLMSFHQAVGIILGTNIGTTLTGQIMAFNLEKMGFPLLFISLFFLAFPQRWRTFGLIINGLAFIFIGMNYMSTAFLFIQKNPLFYQLLLLTNNNRLIAVIAGIVFTALIQSSSAMTGIVLVLAKNGQLNLVTATAVILGSNVGTCFTAILASIHSTTGGKKVAASHVVLNILGVLIFYPFLTEFTTLMSFTSSNLPRQIAHTHTVFNIVSSLVVLPFTGLFAKFISWFIPGKNE